MQGASVGYLESTLSAEPGIFTIIRGAYFKRYSFIIKEIENQTVIKWFCKYTQEKTKHMATTKTAAKPATKKIRKWGNIEDTEFHAFFIDELKDIQAAFCVQPSF